MAISNIELKSGHIRRVYRNLNVIPTPTVNPNKTQQVEEVNQVEEVTKMYQRLSAVDLVEATKYAEELSKHPSLLHEVYKGMSWAVAYLGDKSVEPRRPSDLWTCSTPMPIDH